MYNIRPNLYIGFHGCSIEVRDQLLINPDEVKTSEKPYDWLGHGSYIWENNFTRALRWAEDRHKKSAAVIGVIYSLDNCLDFTDSEAIESISTYYEFMVDDYESTGKHLPKNRDLQADIHNDKILRDLDCAVIQYMHQQISDSIAEDPGTQLRHFDTVRGIFTEGGEAFPGAGIQTKNHIQICIRNLNCIKGFFLPRKPVPFP